MLFDWDEANIRHIARHRILPEQVEELFAGIYFELGFIVNDGEERTSVIGETKRGRILIVWFTWREDKLRTISSWDATKADKVRYLQAKGSGHEI